MNDAKLTKMLQKARNGDVDALNELRQEIPASATVFVLKDDELQVQPTLEAIRYRQRYGVDPNEWDDLPTLTLAEAFAEKAGLDPIQLKPVTPGLWAKLWELPNGHDMVAALYWGTRNRHITDSELEIKAKVQAMLDGNAYPLLAQVLIKLKADEDAYEAAKRAVKRRMTPPPAQTLKSTPSPFDQRGQHVGLQVNVPPSGAIAQGPGAVAAGPGGMAVGGNVYGGISITSQDAKPTTTLHRALMAAFRDDQLHTLAFDMGIDYESLPGSSKDAKARELVLYCQRRSRLRELTNKLEQGNYHQFQTWFPEGNPF